MPIHSPLRKGEIEGASAPSNIIPLPLIKGKGIKGIGLVGKRKGVFYKKPFLIYSTVYDSL